MCCCCNCVTGGGRGGEGFNTGSYVCYLKGWSEIEAVDWWMRHLSHMDVYIRDTSSKPRQQPHYGVVFGSLWKCYENVTSFGRSGVFPKFWGQDELSSFLEGPYGRELTNSIIQFHWEQLRFAVTYSALSSVNPCSCKILKMDTLSFFCLFRHFHWPACWHWKTRFKHFLIMFQNTQTVWVYPF